MNMTRWILVPLGTDKDKQLFEQFIKERTGRRFEVGNQYRSGLVMQLVSLDLKSFGRTNITCGRCAFYLTKGINDFLNRYEDIKNKETALIIKEKIYRHR